MPRIVLFNKPFRVMSQFRESGEKVTMSQYFYDPALRVAGRLDYDSEGLLLLSDDGQLIERITNPQRRTWKTYWVQVEGIPTSAALADLRRGIELKDGPTLPARVEAVAEPAWLWPRQPPIRVRRHQPESWLTLSICEGRNRQVRRMTAAVGHPTLRLVRGQVGDWSLDGLAPGEHRELRINLPRRAPVSRRRPPV